MSKPSVLILSGYGINCEAETKYAFETAGATADIVHINDLVAETHHFADYQILAVPGGFSYGDDTGSGNAFARRLENNLKERVWRFLERDTLAIGICNGCQILTALGAAAPKEEAAILHNVNGRYECRWVNLKADPNSQSPWLKDVDQLFVPVAHGEGRFKFKDGADITPALTYVTEDGAPANGAFPANPNGADLDCAAVTDKSGRVLAIMPHPERAVSFTQRPDWPLLKEQLKRAGKPLPTDGDGIKMFQNAVAYFA